MCAENTDRGIEMGVRRSMNMTPNPLYDTNVIYDTIQDGQAACHAQPRATVNTSKGSQPPPQVPPPRNGAAATASTLGLPVGEDYVQMTSASARLSAAFPRYSEPPSLNISDDQPSQQVGNTTAGVA